MGDQFPESLGQLVGEGDIAPVVALRALDEDADAGAAIGDRSGDGGDAVVHVDVDKREGQDFAAATAGRGEAEHIGVEGGVVLSRPP